MAATQVKKNSNVCSTIIILVIAAVFLYACPNNNNPTIVMSKERSHLQQPGDTERLLSVVNLEQTDGGKVVVAFFETPQIFEFLLGTAQAELNYKLLSAAKEQQLPVNISSTVAADKNRIDVVTPATADQVKIYFKEKGQQQPATPVPKPK